MCAADWLWHDFVNQLQLLQVLSGQFQRVGGRLGLIRAAPRIDAQPSGEITEYMLCSSITKWFAVASAIAPPDPPSPMMTLMIGTRTWRQASMQAAMASDWPRSSAPMPG